jgi:hypothetical protein
VKKKKTPQNLVAFDSVIGKVEQAPFTFPFPLNAGITPGIEQLFEKSEKVHHKRWIGKRNRFGVGEGFELRVFMLIGALPLESYL